jgi:hypothetical protein
MDQSQIDELKAMRKSSTKKIKKKVSKIIKIMCDCSDIQLSDNDMAAFEEAREQIRVKKLKYANSQ